MGYSEQLQPLLDIDCKVAHCLAKTAYIEEVYGRQMIYNLIVQITKMKPLT